MKKVLVLTAAVLALTAVGCGHPDYTGDVDNQCTETIPEGNGLPTVLVIGDSISGGYTPYVTSDLAGQYQVVHNPCNARSSRNTALYAETWLAQREHFEVITWNNGLWDADWGRYRQTPEMYEANLRKIAPLLKAKADKVLFFTTTVISQSDAAGRPYGSEVNLNAIAKRVMAEFEIPVYDLYEVSAQIPVSQHTAPNDVHYTAQGYRTLADFVTASILDVASH